MSKKPSRIRQIRERASLSQAALADLAHVDPSTIYRWEAGTRTISKAMFEYIEGICRDATAPTKRRNGSRVAV